MNWRVRIRVGWAVVLAIVLITLMYSIFLSSTDLASLSLSISGLSSSESDSDDDPVPFSSPPSVLTGTAESGPGSSSSNQSFQRPVLPEEEDKYFHEPTGNQERIHYDARFFNWTIPRKDRVGVLHDLISSYLLFCDQVGIETWLAHGTLLGWWWNNRLLPWDYDIDVQVSEETLYRLGTGFNMTRYEYCPWVKPRQTPTGSGTDDEAGKDDDSDDEDGDEAPKPISVAATGRFLLDVNTWIWNRRYGEGLNVIDARWIDTKSGLFIDITGLAVVPDGDRKRPAGDGPGRVVGCKNEHEYKVGELFPLRMTDFEGVRAYVPFAYGNILREEYGPRCMDRVQFNGYLFNSTLEVWIPIAEPSELEG